MSVRLSKKYGLNPSVLQCPICGKEFGLAMFGTSWKDKETGRTTEAPRTVALPNQFCDDCTKVLDQEGCFFIAIKDEEEGKKNPYRTGKIIAIKREKALEIFPGCHRVNYIVDSLFDKVFSEALAAQHEQEHQQQN